MPQAILFDLDGVLVDACELHRQALNQALEEVGYTITLDEHYTHYNGRPTKVKLQILTQEKGLPVELHEQISRRKQECTADWISRTVTPNFRAQALLKELGNRRFKVAVCSNSVRRSVELLLGAAELLPYVGAIVGNDEGIKPKPAPDLFLEGARRLGVPIDECVIVEDSTVGILAAHAANPERVVVVKGPDCVNVSLLPRLLGE